MALKIERKLILASASPSRKMLLEQAGWISRWWFPAWTRPSPRTTPPPRPWRLWPSARGRPCRPPPGGAHHRRGLCGEHRRLILGKPKDDEAAKATLRRLSGRTHELITGVCLLINGRMDLFHQSPG